MSWNLEFVAEWQMFMDTVESRLRQEVERKDRLGLITVNAIIETELSKWDVQQNREGAWLGKLMVAHPELGQEFQATLKKIRLNKSLDFEPLPFELRVVAGIALTMLTLLMMRWQKMSTLKQLVGVGAVVGDMSLFYRVLWPKYRKQVMDTLIAQFRQEMSLAEQKLQEIVAKADGQ